jgi:5-formyltetrahydrofolate cyclo-ligase
MQSLSRTQLRKHLQLLRSHLSSEYIQCSSQKISDRLLKHPLWHGALHIGIYLSIKNEVDTQYLLEAIWKTGKNAYLPRIQDNHELAFAPYVSETALSRSRFGILEPATPIDFCKTADLDLVIVPLLGFDPKCNRLGMGAGHYDRTFAFLHTENKPPKPILIGVAYETQKVDSLPAEKWDVPLDLIVTEKELYPVGLY